MKLIITSNNANPFQFTSTDFIDWEIEPQNTITIEEFKKEYNNQIKTDFTIDENYTLEDAQFDIMSFHGRQQFKLIFPRFKLPSYLFQRPNIWVLPYFKGNKSDELLETIKKKCLWEDLLSGEFKFELIPQNQNANRFIDLRRFYNLMVCDFRDHPKFNLDNFQEHFQEYFHPETVKLTGHKFQNFEIKPTHRPDVLVIVDIVKSDTTKLGEFIKNHGISSGYIECPYWFLDVDFSQCFPDWKEKIKKVNYYIENGPPIPGIYFPGGTKYRQKHNIHD